MPQGTKTEHPTDTSEISLRIRRDGWKHFTEHGGFATDAQLARAMNVSGATLSRVMSGRCEPSGKFIVRALHAMPSARFADLFEAFIGPATQEGRPHDGRQPRRKP